MTITIEPTKLQEILPLRILFLQENNMQIRYHACHERNWTDSYLIKSGNKKIGYGAIKGKKNLSDRDAVFEFYLLPPYRNKANLIFRELLNISSAPFIACQSNDFLCSSMLYEFAKNISSDVILFEAHQPSNYTKPAVVFRPYKKGDDVFGKEEKDVGEYVLDKNGEIIGTGGFLLHYNIPFADLYMEIKEDYRRMGYGSFIIQELIKACYLARRIPAARCNISNLASKATLIKGGLRVCGYMLIGEVYSGK